MRYWSSVHLPECISVYTVYHYLRTVLFKGILHKTASFDGEVCILPTHVQQQKFCYVESSITDLAEDVFDAPCYATTEPC